ncbi:MAG: hypothetical protein CBE10_00970 [bacterium TMED250]|nr:MAG: hypothetical protein CBE10_00970 [bacterium TMED250]|tara:strand:+ start:30308 stop:31039 length:732 start_codon:yes stop_codon:yes gene_type:complete
MRRFWLLRNRLVITAPIIILTPIAFHVFLSSVINNIYSSSPNGIPIESWLLPGVIFSFGSLTMLAILYRDLFNPQSNLQFLKLLSISPNSKFKIILAILLSSLIECLFYSIISTLTLLIFMPDPFSFSEFLSILFYLIFYLGLFGNCIITLSIYVQRGFTFLFLSFVFLQLLFVSSNILFEQQIYSQMMNMIFFNNPFNMLLYDLRYFIFFGETSFIWVAISIALSLLWVFLNSLFLKNKLNQ